MSILVAGSLHLDVVLRAPRLPGLDETVTGSSVDYVFGGKGGNQAVGAARMGADVALAGRAGSDAFGDMIRDSLRQSGVDLAQLQHDEGPSGMSAAILDDQGRYGAVIVSACNLKIDAQQIEIPPETRLVLLQNEIPEPVNLAVARKARAAGAEVWLNGAPARPLSRQLCDAVDLLIVNRVEAAFYGAQENMPETLTTLGPDGVAFRGRHFAGFRVDVVSAHGAGDMFVGALGARVAAGADIVDALPFAQAAAALLVALPTEERNTLDAPRVDAFLTAQSRR